LNRSYAIQSHSSTGFFPPAARGEWSSKKSNTGCDAFCPADAVGNVDQKDFLNIFFPFVLFFFYEEA